VDLARNSLCFSHGMSLPKNSSALHHAARPGTFQLSRRRSATAAAALQPPAHRGVSTPASAAMKLKELHALMQVR
jgi:hypothetical protein